jgi:HEAT repeat protein
MDKNIRFFVTFLFLLFVFNHFTFAKKPTRKEEYEAASFAVLDKAIKSGDGEIRSIAVLGFTKLKIKNPLTYILEAFKDTQWIVRRSAIAALIKLNRKNDYSPKIREALRDPMLPLEKDTFIILDELNPKEAELFYAEVLLDPKAATKDKLCQSAVSKGGQIMFFAYRKAFASGNQVIKDVFMSHLEEILPVDREGLVTALLSENNPDAVKTALDLSEKWQIKVNPLLLKKFIKSSDSELKIRTAEILLVHGDKDGAAIMMPLLDSSDQKLQIRALKSLSYIATSDLIPAVQKFLKPDTPPEVLELVYAIYANAHDESILEKVNEDLSSTLIARRIAATAVIGKILGSRALPTLHRLLFDGNIEIRLKSAQSIGDLAQLESVEVLGRAVSDTDKNVRIEVLKAFGKIRDKSIIPKIAFLITDVDQDVRKEAIKALSVVQHQDALPALRLTANDPNPAVRVATLRAIMKINASLAKEFFEQGANWFPAGEVIPFMREFRADFVPFLEAGLESDKIELRVQVLKALKEMPDFEEGILVKIGLNSKFPDVKIGSLKSIVAKKGAKAIDYINAMLTDKIPDVRATAIELLADVGGDSVVDAVRAGFLDESEKVRVVAASSLLKFPKGKK